MGRLFIAGKMLATGKSCYFSRDFGGNGWQSKIYYVVNLTTGKNIRPMRSV